MKENIELKLKSLLEIDQTKTISKTEIIDKLDALLSSGKNTGLHPGSITCMVNSRSDNRMKCLESLGIVRKDEAMSNEKHMFYRLTHKGYDVLDISQKYIQGR